MSIHSSSLRTTSARTSSAVTLNALSFAWPDGTPALSEITARFGVGRTGLVGTNGSGKSTLLRLIAGQLLPLSGQIITSGDVGYLPQTLTLTPGRTVADLLGASDKLAALRAIEAGDVAEHHFERLGDDWDIETRASEALHTIGLTAGDLDRDVTHLSGGEAMLVAIAGIQLHRPAITLLDEPTNNLDRDARARLHSLVSDWAGTLIVVSHDTMLLEQMDSIAELYNNELTTFGGPYSVWREHHERQQAAAAHSVRSAEQSLKAEKRQRLEAESTLARRARAAQKSYDTRSAAKIVMNQNASNAQVSAGKLRGVSDSRVQAAKNALDAAERRLRDDESIHLELPDPAVASSRRVAELYDASGETTFVVQGPERVALIGANGVGKSTLLAALVSGTADNADAATGETAMSEVADTASGRLLTDRVGYLSQTLDGLDPDANSIENVQRAASALPVGEIRNRLARLLLRGDSVTRPVHTLSGGERFRVALACLLYADPPCQLLILDEPTNNLDLQSVEQLVTALRSYRGALLVVSHDDAFLRRLHLDRTLLLEREGMLREVDILR